MLPFDILLFKNFKMRYLKTRFMESKISLLLQMVEYTEHHTILI